MKETIELIIAFIVIMSALVGFLFVTSTTGTTHLYNLPSSMVQAFAYDTEDLLSGHDLFDLNNPETIFNGLDELYPELHYRIKISSLYIENQDNVVYLNNSNGQYLDFVYQSPNKGVNVCVPEPAEVTVVALKTAQKKEMIDIEGPIYVDTCQFISISPPIPTSARSLAIAIMKTQTTTYVAYKINKDKPYIESYFTFQENGLLVMIPKEASDGSNVLLSHHGAETLHETYMVILRNDGTVEYRMIYLKFLTENNYYIFEAYDENGNKIIQVNDGSVLAIVPQRPQKIVSPHYTIIATPFVGAEEGFEIIYGATPPQDFPASSYQYITYIDGVPVLVTVEMWRASA